MSQKAPLPTPADLDPEGLDQLLGDLRAGDVKACCATVYEHPAVRWLLGGELHPGGEDLTRRALELIELGPEDCLLDIASGAGTSALLAARERGARVHGVDLGMEAVAGANQAAHEAGLADRVEFTVADAERLPFSDGSFDAILCECALCTFPDKPSAVAEMKRVLRPGGRVAMSDVVADYARLPEDLSGTMATVACVGSALPEPGYRQLFEEAGFEVTAVEHATEDVARMTKRVKTRLRGAKVMGMEGLVPIEGGLRHAIELAEEAKGAVADGALGYAVFAARLPG